LGTVRYHDTHIGGAGEKRVSEEMQQLKSGAGKRKIWKKNQVRGARLKG